MWLIVTARHVLTWPSANFFSTFFFLLLVLKGEANNIMSTQAASNIIGSLIFCPECGNLLDMAGGDDDILVCGHCSCSFRTAGKGRYTS
jgi:ribosomal protein S27AE